jgi:hypothetical protein
MDHGFYSAVIVLQWYAYLMQLCKWKSEYFFIPIVDCAGAISLLQIQVIPIKEFEPHEIEKLFILEHRRWVTEQEAGGWVYADKKDIRKKQSPYLAPRVEFLPFICYCSIHFIVTS